MTHTLILPCAGTGSRFGGCKQLQELNGRAVFLRALDAFVGFIGHAIIPASPAIHASITALLRDETYPFSVRVIDGGASRFHSVYNGIQHCTRVPENEHGGYILVHDAARPCVRGDSIQRCLDALTTHSAAILALPCRDSLKAGTAVNEHTATIAHSINREHVWMAQTPQAFHASIAHSVYQQAADEDWQCTDDADIFKRAGHAVALVMGDPLNIKLTYPEDWALAELLVRS